jgi:hypothetical protein
MQDVVRQLVGFGLVAGHVMNLKGSQRAATHGEMLHAPSMHAHVWAVLTLALHVLFYYIDPCYAMERHAGKAKFKNKFYFQYEREDSWTRPGVRAFGRANGGTAFQGFQIRAGNAVPLCHVFFADKAGSTKNSTHHPIYGELSISSLLKPTKTKLLSLPNFVLLEAQAILQSSIPLP